MRIMICTVCLGCPYLDKLQYLEGKRGAVSRLRQRVTGIVAWQHMGQEVYLEGSIALRSGIDIVASTVVDCAFLGAPPPTPVIVVS